LWKVLPEGYPNLTFYVALAALPVRHLIFLTAGDAYGAMTVDAATLASALAAALAPGCARSLGCDEFGAPAAIDITIAAFAEPASFPTYECSPS
jgi:hypothetical protein